MWSSNVRVTLGGVGIVMIAMGIGWVVILLPSIATGLPANSAEMASGDASAWVLAFLFIFGVLLATYGFIWNRR
jgi:hypothetical protein